MAKVRLFFHKQVGSLVQLLETKAGCATGLQRRSPILELLTGSGINDSEIIHAPANKMIDIQQTVL
jgi:hypothetical protein